MSEVSTSPALTSRVTSNDRKVADNQVLRITAPLFGIFPLVNRGYRVKELIKKGVKMSRVITFLIVVGLLLSVGMPVLANNGKPPSHSQAGGNGKGQGHQEANQQGNHGGNQNQPQRPDHDPGRHTGDHGMPVSPGNPQRPDKVCDNGEPDSCGSSPPDRPEPPSRPDPPDSQPAPVEPPPVGPPDPTFCAYEVRPKGFQFVLEVYQEGHTPGVHQQLNHWQGGYSGASFLLSCGATVDFFSWNEVTGWAYLKSVTAPTEGKSTLWVSFGVPANVARLR